MDTRVLLKTTTFEFKDKKSFSLENTKKKSENLRSFEETFMIAIFYFLKTMTMQTVWDLKNTTFKLFYMRKLSQMYIVPN